MSRFYYKYVGFVLLLFFILFVAIKTGFLLSTTLVQTADTQFSHWYKWRCHMLPHISSADTQTFNWNKKHFEFACNYTINGVHWLVSLWIWNTCRMHLPHENCAANVVLAYNFPIYRNVQNNGGIECKMTFTRQQCAAMLTLVLGSLSLVHRISLPPSDKYLLFAHTNHFGGRINSIAKYVGRKLIKQKTKQKSYFVPCRLKIALILCCWQRNGMRIVFRFRYLQPNANEEISPFQKLE